MLPRQTPSLCNPGCSPAAAPLVLPRQKPSLCNPTFPPPCYRRQRKSPVGGSLGAHRKRRKLSQLPLPATGATGRAQRGKDRRPWGLGGILARQAEGIVTTPPSATCANRSSPVDPVSHPQDRTGTEGIVTTPPSVTVTTGSGTPGASKIYLSRNRTGTEGIATTPPRLQVTIGEAQWTPQAIPKGTP